MSRRCPLSSRALSSLGTLLLLAFAPLAAPQVAAADAGLRIVSTTPVDGARLVRPETALLVRFDRVLPGGALPALTVTGSVSGRHEGRAVRADGGRVLLFRPDRAFAAGERVTFALAGQAAAHFEVAAHAGRLDDALRARMRAAEGTVDPLAGLMAQATAPGPGILSDSVPNNPYPTVVTTVYDEPSDGVLFMSNFSTAGHGAPFLLILGNDGTPVFYRQMLSMCTDFKMQPNGTLTYYDTGKGRYYALNESYAIVDSFECANGYDTDEHELIFLPDGHYLMLGDDWQTVDMSQVVPNGNPNAQVIGNIIQEFDADKNLVFEWRSWDHFQITDATHEALTASVIDYVHANAIDVDTDGNLLLSSRHLDEITKIDRTTGALIWRWGGKNDQFTWVDPEGKFSHQHAIRRIANGHVTLFDNGDYRTPTPYSRASEYALDEVNHVATLAWEFRNSPDSYGNAMGYVQRLDDGHTLIGWGTGNPDAIEVDAAGHKIMEVSLPAGQSSYRTLRQDWQPDLAGVGPGTPGSTPAVALTGNAPNPFHGRTELTLALAAPAHVTLAVFDLAGRKVQDVLKDDARGPGLTRVAIDLSGQPGGVYFARATTERGAVSRRLVHLN